MAALKRSQFRFRKNERIGTEDAESDDTFLRDCFVDTGDLDTLRDTENAMSIVVGRTGCGKTAVPILLRESSTHVTWLEPDELSLRYLPNSTIIQYLDKLGGKRENASPRSSVWFGTSTRSEKVMAA